MSEPDRSLHVGHPGEERTAEERVKQTRIERLLTAQQVADFLSVSVCSVGRWSRRGLLRSYHVGGRGDLRFKLEDVLRFLEKSEAGSWTNAAD